MPAWLRFPEWFKVILTAIAEGAIAYLLRSPRLMRAIAGLLQRIAPVFTGVPGFVVVTRGDDVREVLERHDDFLLGPINNAKMMTGDFVISLDPGRQYDREKYLLHEVLTPASVGVLAGLVDRAAADAWVETPRAGKRINAVEFAERFTLQVVERFWGLDGAAAKSEVVSVPQGRDTLRMWLRRLAAVLTSTEPAPFGLWQVGWLCRREYMAYIEQACRLRAARPPGGDDVLSQLTFLQLPGSEPAPTPEEIARNIGGLIVTGSAVVTKAFAHALEQVLIRETPRRGLIAAARAGNRDDVRRYLIEGLRFKPVFPMLARRSVRATTLARGTPREAEVRAGDTVYISPIGAMFDPAAVDRPEAFDHRREFDSNPWLSRQAPARFRPPNPYLIFGFGVHWCPADELALQEITALAMRLLAEIAEPRLVAPLRYDGPAARELYVEAA